MTLKKFITGVLLVLVAWAEAEAIDLTGTWKSTVKNPRGTFEQTFEFKQIGDKLTGYIASPQGHREEIKDGKVNADQIEFRVERQQPSGQNFTVPYKGTVKGDEITGTFAGPGGHTTEWSATRQKAGQK